VVLLNAGGLASFFAVQSKSVSRHGKERSQSSSIEKYHLIRNLSNDNSDDDQNKESQRDKNKIKS
jgi:hypothetical protein